MKRLSLERAKDLYKSISRIDQSSPVWAEKLKGAHSSVEIADEIQLLKKIALNSYENDFVSFVVDNEVPTINLPIKIWNFLRAE
jgi:hypothetical protein